MSRHRLSVGEFAVTLEEAKGVIFRLETENSMLRKLLSRLLANNDGCNPKLADQCVAVLATGGGK